MLILIIRRAVGELTGLRHILPQDGSQFLARDFASPRRCAVRSRIATHSHEVRSLQRYESKSTLPPRYVAARAVMAARRRWWALEKPDFDKQPEQIFKSFFVNQSAGGVGVVTSWATALWGA